MLSPLPETSGIYRITCTSSGKFYIGSSNNLRRRWKDHRKELRRNEHGNQKLQNAWNKYGEQSFTFEVIELVLTPFLIEREQYWLDTLKPFGHKGLNIALSAQSFSLGLTRSPETRAKMSAARKGKPSTRIGYTPSLETRAKLRAANLGKKQSDETRVKKSIAHTGRKQGPPSAETREKIRIANTGKKQSAETIAKISATVTGRKRDPAIYENRRKTLIVTSPDGVEFTVTGIRQFCREHNLHSSNLVAVAQGRQSHAKGWKARYLEQ